MKLYKIKKSNIDNRGLYANQNIKNGTKIIEYREQNYNKKAEERIQNLIMKKLFIFLT